MPKAKPIEKIHAAAYHFAHISRDAHNIAKAFDVSVWTLRQYWSQTPEWHNALDAFGYDGDRAFVKRSTRNAQRENGETFEKVKTCYIEAQASGVPTHKLPTYVERETGISKRKVARWAERYGWKSEI